MVAFRCSAFRWDLTDSPGEPTSSPFVVLFGSRTPGAVQRYTSGVNAVITARVHGGCRIHPLKVPRPTSDQQQYLLLEEPFWSRHPCRMKSFTLALLANNHE